MISDEAVEAAAKAITARYGDPVRRWKQDVYDAKVALEAAAPHMLEQAWDAAFKKGADWVEAAGECPDEQQNWTNPYRSQA